MSGFGQHQQSEHTVMQARQHLRQAFISLWQGGGSGPPRPKSAPARKPGRDPAARQKHKAFLGLREPHDMKFYALLSRGLGRHSARAALVNIS